MELSSAISSMDLGAPALKYRRKSARTFVTRGLAVTAPNVSACPPPLRAPPPGATPQQSAQMLEIVRLHQQEHRIHFPSLLALKSPLHSTAETLSEKKCEPQGGTYLTLLNTISNMGVILPKFAIFASIDWLSTRSCIGAATDVSASACAVNQARVALQSRHPLH